MPSNTRRRTRFVRHRLLLPFPRFTGFTADLLAEIVQAFAQVRFDRTYFANISRYLTNNFFVVAHYLNLASLDINLKGNSFSRLNHDRMRKTHMKYKVEARHL